MINYIVACLLAAATIASAQPFVVSGPTVGHVDMRSASITVQIGFRSQPVRTDVAVRYTDIASKRTYTTPQVYYGYPGNAGCMGFMLDSVEPGRTYTYEILVGGEALDVSVPTRFTSRSIFRYRGNDWPTVSLAFGSCHYVNQAGYERHDSTGKERGYGTETGIFDAIVQRNPDAMLWLGDNVYLRDPDWGSRSGILKRYSHTRAHSRTRELFASIPNYAIWDDHDYGPNDADRSYVLKDDALDAFKLFWPNPSYGVGGKPGITSSFELADVQVFLLDDRFYRSSNDRHDEPKTILGQHQDEWLIDALSSSKATFKLVAVGSQFLSDNKRREGFEKSPEERQRILDLITRNNVSGVMFMSGDVHFAELSRLDREGTYPIYEITSSPLSSGLNTSPVYRANSYHVAGTEFIGHNFGHITVSGQRGKRILTIRIVDATGKDVWIREIPESELRKNG
ncbi:MAG: alkaline phosphatase family protein [Ignavibacteria bacterium]|nr:alkaline phosphatase family protein [Ignavibacteria bacterium]